LKFLTEETRTIIFYESPHKIAKTLVDLATYFGTDRKASVSRELTKIYEETIRGSLEELVNHFSNSTTKGEIVIIVEGKE
jgi:16S rRNA (cytidine1402-2'-O)-methyltransferase